jgi:hypothetical protein
LITNLCKGAKPPPWVVGAPKLQDIRRFEGVDDTPELAAMLVYLSDGPEAGVAEPQGVHCEWDLLYHEVLSATCHMLLLEATLVSDPLDFTSVLRRVCGWFQDMLEKYRIIEDERHFQDKRDRVSTSGRGAGGPGSGAH